MRRGKYFLLGLAPRRIVERNRYLRIFWDNIETLYKSLLLVIVTGKSNEPMNELEEALTNLKRHTDLDKDHGMVIETAFGGKRCDCVDQGSPLP